MPDLLPPHSGTYALILRLDRAREIQVGHLGQFDFPVGTYIYLGSACGSGGLRARLSHHLKLSVTPHWHLDWLRPYLEMVAVVYRLGEELLECTWVQHVSRMPGARVIAPGFGNRDCRAGCLAHLIYFHAPVEPKVVGGVLGSDEIVIFNPTR